MTNFFWRKNQDSGVSMLESADSSIFRILLLSVYNKGITGQIALTGIESCLQLGQGNVAPV